MPHRFDLVPILICCLLLGVACGDDVAGGFGGNAGDAGNEGTAGTGGVAGEVAVELNICCDITTPIPVGEFDATVEATALPIDSLVPGEAGLVELRGSVDITGAIPAAIEATLIEPSTFTLVGVEGTSSSDTFSVPTPQLFNTGDDPLLLDIGVHEASVEVDSDATQVCFELTEANVSVFASPAEVSIPCSPGRCDGTPNTPICLPVSVD